MLIVMRRKDDYAFFLQPVDPAQVPGYSDVISRPMDLGTMTTKVEKGKYRSLEEFAVRILCSQLFHPSGRSAHSPYEFVFIPSKPGLTLHCYSRISSLLRRMQRLSIPRARYITPKPNE